MSKKAFSLIELSIVLVIIGLLVAGITQSSRLVQKFRISTAQTLTQSSPVNGIKNLVAWYETTSQASFDSSIDDGVAVSNWYDISPSVDKSNATQTTAANRPVYTENDINSLPTLKFTATSSQFLNLPDGTIPYNNSPYTIFIVAKADKLCGNPGPGECGLLGGGATIDNQMNGLRYKDAASGQDKAGFQSQWYAMDAYTTSSLLTVTSPHIVVSYYNQKARRIIFNGSEQAMSSGATLINNQATALNNFIGRLMGSAQLTGSIGEIIIFNRALMAEEIDSIESYLSKKWGIKTS
jgi:prepilin-type N-terminal cleavage/methylation domain-containing protein